MYAVRCDVQNVISAAGSPTRTDSSMLFKAARMLSINSTSKLFSPLDRDRMYNGPSLTSFTLIFSQS